MGIPGSTTGMLKPSEPLFEEKEGEMNLLILHIYFRTLTQLSTHPEFLQITFQKLKLLKVSFHFIISFILEGSDVYIYFTSGMRNGQGQYM